MVPPGFEPGTFRVLDWCANHFTAAEIPSKRQPCANLAANLSNPHYNIQVKFAASQGISGSVG